MTGKARSAREVGRRSGIRRAHHGVDRHDHRSFAELLVGPLGNVDGLTVLASRHTASAGITMVAELAPSVVVMDIQMPDEDGLVTTKRIRESAPERWSPSSPLTRPRTGWTGPLRPRIRLHTEERISRPDAPLLKRVRQGRMIVGAAAVPADPLHARRLSGAAPYRR